MTYDKACKAELLEISPEVLEKCTAVSAEIVSAMTEGALAHCKSATIAIAITCVGGPKPDEDGNPVGLTYLAVKQRYGHVQIRRLQIDEHLSGRIRGEVLSHACQLLPEALTSAT